MLIKRNEQITPSEGPLLLGLPRWSDHVNPTSSPWSRAATCGASSLSKLNLYHFQLEHYSSTHIREYSQITEEMMSFKEF